MGLYANYPIALRHGDGIEYALSVKLRRVSWAWDTLGQQALGALCFYQVLFFIFISKSSDFENGSLTLIPFFIKCSAIACWYRSLSSAMIALATLRQSYGKTQQLCVNWADLSSPSAILWFLLGFFFVICRLWRI